MIALWIAARDARTPTLAKVVAALVSAYALSPIDLIPDFIPVLGYLDDVILVPAGVLLALRLIPSELMDEFRDRAATLAERPTSRWGLVTIIAIWAAFGGVAAWWIWQAWGALNAPGARHGRAKSPGADLASQDGGSQRPRGLDRIRGGVEQLTFS